VEARRSAVGLGKRSLGVVVLPSELARLARRGEAAAVAPEDPEALHQLRVACRRVRAVAEQVSVGFGPELTEATERLAEVQRRLGTLRDADVLAERVGALEGLMPPWWEGSLALSLSDEGRQARVLDARAHVVRSAAAEVISVARRLEDLVMATAGPELSVRRARPAARRSLRRLARRLERRLAAIDAQPSDAGQAATPLEGRSAAHRARIAAKRYRYVLDAFSALGVVDPRPALSQALQALQEALGVGLDAERARRALGETQDWPARESALAAVVWAVATVDLSHASIEAALAARAVSLVGSPASWS